MTKPKIWQVLELLRWTSDYFKKHDIPTPQLDAEVLLAHILKKNRLYLYLHYEMPVFQEHLAPFRELIKKRVARTPVSYLTNQKEFMSLDFYVDERVLIPRQETEQLVETILRDDTDETQHILELGTGSGVIATSIAVHRPEWTIVATDISKKALAVAKKNAETHDCTEKINFLAGNLFTPLDTHLSKPTLFNWIVCNPPYIKSGERNTLSADVRNYEPAIALFAGDDGLDVIRRLVTEAPEYLAPNGKLIFEIGDTQADAVRSIMDAEPVYRTYKLLKDYARKERVVFASI